MDTAVVEGMFLLVGITFNEHRFFYGWCYCCGEATRPFLRFYLLCPLKAQVCSSTKKNGQGAEARTRRSPVARLFHSGYSRLRMLDG